jgi:uncharacterized membrane protein required for colicin V production
MNAADWTTIGILLAGLITGTASGLFRTAMGLAAFVGALLLSVLWADQIALWIVQHTGWSSRIALAATVVGLLLAANILIVVIGTPLVKLLRAIPPFGLLDRIAGGLLGLALSLVLVSTAVYILRTAVPNGEIAHKIETSHLAREVAPVAPWILTRITGQLPGVSSVLDLIGESRNLQPSL